MAYLESASQKYMSQPIQYLYYQISLFLCYFASENLSKRQEKLANVNWSFLCDHFNGQCKMSNAQSAEKQILILSFHANRGNGLRMVNVNAVVDWIPMFNLVIIIYLSVERCFLLPQSMLCIVHSLDYHIIKWLYIFVM